MDGALLVYLFGSFNSLGQHWCFPSLIGIQRRRASRGSLLFSATCCSCQGGDGGEPTNLLPPGAGRPSIVGHGPEEARRRGLLRWGRSKGGGLLECGGLFGTANRPMAKCEAVPDRSLKSQARNEQLRSVGWEGGGGGMTTFEYIYIYIYICIHQCMCVCVQDRSHLSTAPKRAFESCTGTSGNPNFPK